MRAYSYAPGYAYKHKVSGKKVSAYGAHAGSAYDLVPDGYHITCVDHGKASIVKSFDTQKEASDWCKKQNERWKKIQIEYERVRVEHEKVMAPVNASINWTKYKNNIGATIHSTGEDWFCSPIGSNKYACARYSEWLEGNAEFVFIRTLSEAKAWCERAVRRDREKECFG